MEKMDDREETSQTLDEKHKKELSLLFRDLRSEAISSMEYFKRLTGVNNERFHNAFYHLLQHIENRVQSSVDTILTYAHRYDIDEKTRSNGHRSLVKLVYKCLSHLMLLCRYISLNKESLLFRATHYSNELESYVSLLGQLGACMYYAQQIVKFCEPSELFAIEAYSDDPLAEALMAESDAIDQIPFYGRCLAFQFCESMRRPFTIIHIAMASYSENYESTSGFMKLAGSLLDSGKYWLDPDLRAQQIVNTTRDADIGFCKSFWGLTETPAMKQLPHYMCPNIEVNQVITIKAESFKLPRTSGVGHVTIHPPSAHIGPGPVNIRLISHKRRSGQVVGQDVQGEGQGPRVLEKSPFVLIHCHGGGFVAQSSKSHEVYLRSWAVDLQVPIVSVDYSLAPECPYPRAVEEIFFAYCWVLKNANLVGSVAQKVCITGDSAGGNLSMALTLKSISKGIRPPDGVVAIYTPMLIRYIPSPSRMLSLVDPLLPVGITARCLAAYAGISEEDLFEPIESAPHSVQIHDKMQKVDSPNQHTGLNIILDELENEDLEDNVVLTADSSLQTHGESETKAHRPNTVQQQCQQVKHLPLKSQTPSIASICGEHSHIMTDLCTRSAVNINSNATAIPEIKDQQCTSSSCNSTQLEISPSTSLSPPWYAQTRHYAQSPTPCRKLRHIHVDRDPLLSPLLASDDLLTEMPPVYLVVSHLDPLLDDSLTFAKKLRSLSKPVQVCLLDDLPHGFLNFTLVSKECKNASNLCVSKIRQVFTNNNKTQIEETDF